MDNLLPPPSHSVHPLSDEPSAASPLPQAVTDFRATSAPMTPLDAGMRQDALPAVNGGTPVLDVIAARQQTADYLRHVSGPETLLAATRLASAQPPASGQTIMSSLALAGRGAADLLANSALTVGPTAAPPIPASSSLTFLTSDTALMQPVAKPVIAPEHTPAAENPTLITFNDASDLQSQPLKLSSYGMDLGPIWVPAPGGGWSTGGGDGGWNISIGPSNPVMPGYYPPPVRLPSPGEVRWSDAHSPNAMATYSNIFRDVFGRNASDADLNWAAQQVGNGWTLEQYRWDQSHTATALDIYRGVFRNVHGRDAAQVDVDFASQKIGHGASLQQYRWDEAHNDEALGREYKAVFKTVHGREAQQVDIDFAAQKIGYGASWQQYWKDEANSPAARAGYANAYKNIHAHDPSQADIDWAAEQISNGYSLKDYRTIEARNAESTRAITSISEQVSGTAPTEAQLEQARYDLGGGWGLDNVRIKLAYSPETANRLSKLYDDAVASLGDAYRETVTVGREVFVKTLQYAAANKEVIFENITAAALARWIPGPIAKYLAALIVREGVELISNTISSNTSHQQKIILKEPTQDGTPVYYPSPSVVTLRKYLDAYFQTDDDKNLDKFPKLGQDDGEPGTYEKANESFGKEAAAYQERVTGTPQGIAYRVPKGNDEFVKFDGYDAERDVLQDAKYYRNWPLPDMKFSREAIMGQVDSQVKAARGTAIEWLVPSQDAADRLLQVFDAARFDLDNNNFSVRIVP